MSSYAWGSRSRSRRDTCHPDLARVLDRAIMISPRDMTIVCGARGRDAQEEAHATGASTKHWPDSKHNVADQDGNEIPNGKSRAADLAPWIHGTIPWSDEGSFYMMASVILVAAKLEGVRIRFGGDWDGDGLTEDQSFHDIGHVELT